MKQAMDRAGKAAKTTAGTSERRGQGDKKQPYGKSEEDKNKIMQDNMAMAEAKKNYQKQLKKERTEAIQEMQRKNRAAAKAFGGVLPARRNPHA